MIVLTLLVLAFAGSSNESSNESYVDEWGVRRKLIVEGTEVTDIRQFPWMVHAGGNCGGAIVSDKFVLTAYHCLNFDAIRLGSTIYAGSVDKKEKVPDNYKRKVVQIFANADIPYYDDSGMGGDAVLLEVDPPWEFDAQVQAIPITPIEPRGKIQVAISTGWGRTVGDEKSSKTNDLRAVQLVLTPCPRGTAFDIFCLVNERPHGGVTCQGDSGGPVIGVLEGRPYLIGVVSAGTVAPGLECKGLALMINLHRWSYWLANFIPETQKGPGPPPARQPPKNWGTSSRMSDDTFVLIFMGWGCIFLLLVGYFFTSTRAPNPARKPMVREMMNPYPQKPGARSSEMRLHHMHGKMSAQQKSSHTSRRPVWGATLKAFAGSSVAKKSRKSHSKSHDQTKKSSKHDQTKKGLSSHDQTKKSSSHDQTKRKSLSSHDQTKRKNLSSHDQAKRMKSHTRTKSLTKRKTLGSHGQTKKKNSSSHDQPKKITRTKSVPCRGKSSNSGRTKCAK